MNKKRVILNGKAKQLWRLATSGAGILLILCALILIGTTLVSAQAEAPNAIAAVLEVDNDGDSSTYLPNATCITGIPNDCSLRQAILVANATAGSDIIRFDLSLYPNGMTIEPNSELPEITRPVEIDGVTGTGGNCPTANDPANLPVTLDGRNLSGDQDGLILGYFEDEDNPFNNTNSNGSTIRGLNIINFPGTGILINWTDDHTIVCNHIGLRDGSATAGNLIGVDVWTRTADNNTIGGPNMVDRNVISGNTIDGIRSTGDSTTIEGNYIGLDKTGTLARGNGENGVEIDDGVFAIVRGNVVSANGYEGIWAEDNSVQIIDNLVGTDATGTLARGNGGNGIEVTGNFATVTGNVSADNGIYGLVLVGNSHTVQGNKIGTSADGSTALGNTYSGILLMGNDSTIGGTNLPADRNIISGNASSGIWLIGDNTVVQGNYIGVAADGSTPLGNEGNGVLLDGAVDNRVGQSGAENIIAHNGLNGIAVKNTGSITSTGNDLRDNIIDNNGGLGIDLYGSGEVVGGVTPNDGDDSDSGPNGLQNHMTLTSAEPNGRVQGVLTGPDGLYQIFIYQRDTCDESGFGEGGSNIARIILAANVSGGVLNYDEVLSPAPPLGSYLVTQVTAPDGSTSEFGNCRQVSDATFAVDSTQDLGDSSPGDGLCESTGLGVCTLRAAIEEVNALGGSPHTITFSFGAVLLDRVIQPSSPLPAITTPIIMDASTMAGASCPTGSSAATHRLILDGTNAPGDGLVLAGSAAGSTIRGFEIRNFSGDGIQVDGDSNVIACNSLHNNFQGINVNGNSNQIGGLTRADRNVVTLNGRWGIRLGNSATLNKVQGNYIGVADDGTTAAGNTDSGIYLSGGGTNRIGGAVGFAANVISANGLHGIEIDAGGGSSNQIWGNIIGLDASGTTALGNSGSGVYVNGANANEIGGDSDEKRNVIAANGGNGIFINSSSNVVARNYIGTDVNGLTDLGNTSMGIRVVDGDSNIIGGDSAADGNLIAGNDDSGIYVAGNGRSVNLIVVLRGSGVVRGGCRECACRIAAEEGEYGD